MRTSLAIIHQPQHQRVQPQAREGNEPFPRRRRAGKEEPPLALVRPCCRAPTLRRICLFRKQLQTVRYHVQRRQYAAPLCGGSPVDHGRVLRAFHSAVDLRFVAHPPSQLLGCWPKSQQVREDFPRAFSEEGILVGPMGEQRSGQRGRLRNVCQFVGGTPVGHALVNGIQDDVTPFWLVEHRRVFERRIVDDGGVATRFHLQKDLPYQGALAHPCIAHNKDVARFGGAGQNEPLRLPEYFLDQCLFCQLKADSIGTIPAVKFPGGHELWSLEPSSFFALASSLGILRDCQRKSHKEKNDASQQAGLYEVQEGFVSIDPLAQEVMQPCVVPRHLLYDKPHVADRHSFRPKCKRSLAGLGLYFDDLLVERPMASFLAHRTHRPIAVGP